MFKSLKNLLKNAHQREDGITGLETAIILIAFVIVASVFAFVVLSTGLFSAERGKDTVFAGLEKARGNMEVRGALTAQDVDADDDIDDEDGADAGTDSDDTLVFNLATAAGGFPVLVNPAATTNSVVINWIDAEDRVADMTYAVNQIQGDGDNLLENGELFEITAYIPTGSALAANEIFTLEVVPPQGGTLLVSRTMPAEIDAVMDLH